MRVIFLDIDGVLLNHGSLRLGGSKHLDLECVKVLNDIIERTGAKVVVSSTWRRFWAKAELIGHLTAFGFRGDVIDYTPSLRYNEGIFAVPRGDEIAAWLAEHSEVTDFVIIDDDSDMARLGHKLVKTSMKTGLTRDHLERCLQQLGSTYEAPQ